MTGWDGSQGVIATSLGMRMLVPFIAYAGTAALPFALAMALAGLGSGYRVVLRRDRVTVCKTWLGIPWRWRSYAADARPDVYWAWEDRNPSGVVMVDAGPRKDEWAWIFGTPKAASRIEALIRDELAYVRAG